MQIQITGNGLEVSPALKALTEKKLHRIETHASDILSIHIVFRVNKNQQLADAVIKLPHHIINAEAESEDMYKTVDLLIHKLLAQLTKYKEKTIDHRDHR